MNEFDNWLIAREDLREDLRATAVEGDIVATCIDALGERDRGCDEPGGLALLYAPVRAALESARRDWEAIVAELRRDDVHGELSDYEMAVPAIDAILERGTAQPVNA